MGQDGFTSWIFDGSSRMARTCFLMWSLYCLGVSGCQAVRPAAVSGFIHSSEVGTVVDNWSLNSAREQASASPARADVTPVSYIVADSNVSMASCPEPVYAESVVVESSSQQDWCPSCDYPCSMSCCLPTKLCCLDNPCQMPPHYAYASANHGYTQFAPYNQSNVMLHKEMAAIQNHDPRQPYVSDVFEQAYERVTGGNEEEYGEEVFDPPVGLPNLLDIVQ